KPNSRRYGHRGSENASLAPPAIRKDRYLISLVVIWRNENDGRGALSPFFISFDPRRTLTFQPFKCCAFFAGTAAVSPSLYKRREQPLRMRWPFRTTPIWKTRPVDTGEQFDLDSEHERLTPGRPLRLLPAALILGLL